MARPGQQDMSRRRRVFEVLKKADFIDFVELLGLKVRQERRKREGWNDSLATIVVRADGAEKEVLDCLKSERRDWHYAYELAEQFAYEGREAGGGPA